MDHDKIINKMNIKEANNMDTTEELGELIETYVEKFPLPTKEEIEEEENELVLKLINEPLSPFYIEFCNQVLRMYDIVYKQLRKNWIEVKRDPVNFDKMKQLYDTVRDHDIISSLLMKKIESVYGCHQYIESDSELDIWITIGNENSVYYTSPDDYIPSLEYWMYYYELMYAEIKQYILNPEYELFDNFYHYCAFTFAPTHCVLCYLRAIKNNQG